MWCLTFWKWDFWSYLPNLWYFVTVYFSLIDILLPFTEKMTGARKEGEEVRSANYFIKLLPCGPLLRTWESTFRKLTSISNNCFFYILLFQTPQKNTCYRFKVHGQTSVNDSFSCCKIDWRMVLSKLRQFSASSPVREKLILLQLEGFVLRFIFKYYLDNAKS